MCIKWHVAVRFTFFVDSMINSVVTGPSLVSRIVYTPLLAVDYIGLRVSNPSQLALYQQLMVSNPKYLQLILTIMPDIILG